MRRRRRSEDVPAHLLRFVPADWPGRTGRQRFEFWREARRAWHEAHGWPGGPVELIRGQLEVRRALDGVRVRRPTGGHL